jgi:hypothetical protein
MPQRVIARSTTPNDLLNEWVVEVDGVRRARFVGPDAVYYAAREANNWRRSL